MALEEKRLDLLIEDLLIMASGGYAPVMKSNDEAVQKVKMVLDQWAITRHIPMLTENLWCHPRCNPSKSIARDDMLICYVCGHPNG